MNEKSMTASSQRLALDRRGADDHRVAEARRDLGFRDALRIGPEVEEAEGILYR